MNPFRADMQEDRTVSPATIVIFGASGDLTKRKLMPALYNLAVERHLSRIAIVGTSRSEISDDSFRASMREGVEKYSRQRPIDRDLWASMEPAIYYQTVGFDDPHAFIRLKERLLEIEK